MFLLIAYVSNNANQSVTIIWRKIMKIALPTRENYIDGHFGHCEYYTVFTIDDSSKEILNQETLASPAGCAAPPMAARTAPAAPARTPRPPRATIPPAPARPA